MLKNIKEWKTTVIGVITIVLFALTSFNVLSADQSEEIKIALEKIIEASGGDLMSLLVVVFGSLSGILAIFVKDPKKEDGKVDN